MLPPPASPSPSAISESQLKRATVFFDCQNLYRSAREAFGQGYTYPDFHPILLAERVCKDNGWSLPGDTKRVRVYTGVPEEREDFFWHHYWTKKLLQLERRGVFVFKRKLKYQDRVTQWPGKIRLCLPNEMERRIGEKLYLADGRELPSGTEFRVHSANEKGVDVRLALDVLNLAIAGNYDVAVIFSQDQDLSELVTDIKELSRRERRWLKLASAFPYNPPYNPDTRPEPRGINDTDWIRIDQEMYDSCRDGQDYRPKRNR